MTTFYYTCPNGDSGQVQALTPYQAADEVLGTRALFLGHITRGGNPGARYGTEDCRGPECRIFLSPVQGATAMLSSEHQAIAKAITRQRRECADDKNPADRESAVRYVAHGIASALHKNDPQFDRGAFLAACGETGY